MAATHLEMGLRCIKYLLFGVNALFVLTGVMIISIGTTIYAVYEDFQHFLDQTYFSPASVLMVLGVLIFVIAFFGCYGAIKESTCMVLVFAFLLTIVLIVEVGTAFSAYLLQDKITSVIRDNINSTMQQYKYNTEAAAGVDFMQSRLQCCGFNGPYDWENILNNENKDFPGPDSCCAFTAVVDDDNKICAGPYQHGCLERLIMIVHRSALNLSTAAIAIALIQFTGIMFAWTLSQAIRKQKTAREKRRWELRENIVSGYQPLGKTDPFTTYPVVYMKSSAPFEASLVP